ncbi:MAG: geranylgeranylglycerol-phosphate geranylgeranyltransferase [Candidatus Krumholzibacteriota bacterium]|nr:geranylgeranylglycerol-phosphate geranylgeranyltransferase [Candidatus Krumholzibacteriota bacterium]
MRRFLKIILIIRPHNVAAAVLCVSAGFVLASSTGDIPIALLTAVALVTAAGNVINDYYDLDIDSINKPRRAIPSGSVSASQARVIYIILLAAAAALLMLLDPVARVWIIAWIVTLHIYSAFLKRMYLSGNLAVSLVTGSGFLLGSYSGGSMAAGVFPSVCTALFVLGRELVKDCEDLDGDARCGARTVPAVSGRKPALRSAALIFLFLAVLFPAAGIVGLYNHIYTGLMFISVLPILVLSAIFSLRGKYHALSSLLLKLGMFFGILAFLFGSTG